MDIILTLCYILFSVCLIYPPTEFVSAGITLNQLLNNYLGSENRNFIEYHIKRITINALVHSMLPLGYMVCLWCSGFYNPWMWAGTVATSIIPLLMFYKIVCWWEDNKIKHPGVKPLLPYVNPSQDWRVVAMDLNVEFWTVDKVSISLSAVSKIVATETWLIKVSQYSLNAVKQSDCTLVATATDSHDITESGDDLVQYVKVEVIPTRNDVERFQFRVSTAALRDLQQRLARPVRVPDNISLLPTLIERFINVFKEHVQRNPVHIVDEEPELCIGCMQVPANVILDKQCLEPPAHLDLVGPTTCQRCNCRVLWCCECMARWWAARAKGPHSTWLAGRCSCPVCRSLFCLLDVCPVRVAPAVAQPRQDQQQRP